LEAEYVVSQNALVDSNFPKAKQRHLIQTALHISDILWPMTARRVSTRHPLEKGKKVAAMPPSVALLLIL
jgi:hypothetical protein